MVGVFVCDEYAVKLSGGHALTLQGGADEPGGYAAVQKDAAAPALYQGAVARGAAGEYDEAHPQPAFQLTGRSSGIWTHWMSAPRARNLPTRS